MLVAEGAEARLYKARCLNETVLVKERVRKSYRVKELDEKIRRERTALECNLLNKAKTAGVRTPVIFAVEKKGAKIVMEFVEGKKLKQALNKKNIGLCEKVGENIGLLHKAGLIHGDLTTNNIIYSKGKLVFLDFGLGFHSDKAEDRAVDLLVFKKTFNATHFDLLKGWSKVIKGYLAAFPKGRKAVEQIPVIEARARYA